MPNPSLQWTARKRAAADFGVELNRCAGEALSVK